MAESWASAWTSLGFAEQYIVDLFVMFITWTSQKLEKFINFCLKVGQSANLNSKPTWRHIIVLWKVQSHNIKSSGHNACSALLDHRTGMIYDSCHFEIGHFCVEPTNYERCLHPSDTFAYRSAHNNLFLRLMHNPQVKKVCRYMDDFFCFCFILFSFCFIFSVDLSLYYDKRGGRRGFFFFFCKIFSFSVTWTFLLKI